DGHVPGGQGRGDAPGEGDLVASGDCGGGRLEGGDDQGLDDEHLDRGGGGTTEGVEGRQLVDRRLLRLVHHARRPRLDGDRLAVAGEGDAGGVLDLPREGDGAAGEQGLRIGGEREDAGGSQRLDRVDPIDGADGVFGGQG